MEAIVTVYTTVSNRDEAIRMGHQLLDEQLIACANVGAEILSLYNWEGARQEEREFPLLMKTTQHLIPELTRRLAELHPYTCPCITAWESVAGDTAYEKWVEAQVRTE